MTCTTKLRFNPLTGQLDLVGVTDTSLSEAIVAEFTVDSGSQVGDLVYQSLTIDQFAVVVTNNNSPGPVIGFISEKPTATTALVTFIGILEGQVGLTRGYQVFVHIDGTVTSTKPSTDYMQTLGYAISATKIYFRPEFRRTKFN